MHDAPAVPTLTADMTPFTAGALGAYAPPLAGPAGVLLSGTQGYARRVGDGWAYEPLALWGWRAATADGFVVVDPQGGVTRVDASGARATPGTSSGPDGMLSAAAVAWDPLRETLVLFGGAIGKRAAADTWEGHEGVWKRAKAKPRPAARSHAQMAWAPPLGGMLVTGGFAKYRHFYDLALYRGGAWEEWPHPAFSDAELAAAFVACDAATGQVIQGFWTSEPRGLGLWRHVGRHRWERAGQVAFPTVGNDLAGLVRMQSFLFALDPATRALVGVGYDDALRPVTLSVPLGAWFDALPPVEE